MKTQKQNLNRIYHCLVCTLWCALYISLPHSSDGASVVSRTPRPTHADTRMPTMTTRIQSGTSTTPPATTLESTTSGTDTSTTTESVPDDTETEIESDAIIDKTAIFDDIISADPGNTDETNNTLAAQIAAQRAALDAASGIQNVSATAQHNISSSQNACDANLRACMQSKCGNDFSKCALDTDTTWGDKMDACRRDLPCTGTEYRLFATEIKADRDANARLASYNAIIDCGNRYNDCIIGECGTTFSRCLGKTAGDTAISKCEQIARDCRAMDSGLASRTMNIFGTLRIDAEKQIARDESRLYELRDAMASTCKRLGAMFDERTLDCVYTVNFFAGDNNTLYASKKAYAGSTFSCDQNWFGVDITTFHENALRLTREQKSATSALMGSGIGMGVGAITSGAIDRAIDRHTAERAEERATAEHNEMYGNGSTDDKKSNKSETKSESSETKSAQKSDKSNKKITKQLEQANKKIIKRQATNSKSNDKIEIPDLSAIEYDPNLGNENNDKIEIPDFEKMELEEMEFDITPVETPSDTDTTTAQDA